MKNFSFILGFIVVLEQDTTFTLPLFTRDYKIIMFSKGSVTSC